MRLVDISKPNIINSTLPDQSEKQRKTLVDQFWSQFVHRLEFDDHHLNQVAQELYHLHVSTVVIYMIL